MVDKRIILVGGIIFLFLFSALAPINLGINIKKITDSSQSNSYNLYQFEDPPNELWNKTYGGNESDHFESVQQTSDNGYIIVGHTRSYGSGELDVWLVKTDIDGNELWNKTYGGLYEEVGLCVRETNDDGFIISGYIISGSDNYINTWLIKTDSEGNKIWDKIFSRTDGESWGKRVLELDDGYLVLSDLFYNHGEKTSDIWLIKTDFDGNEIWNKLIGREDFDWPNSIIQTKSGDFVIVGYRSYNQILMTKTNSYGTILWQKALDGWEGFDIKECDDGGYIIAGREHVCLLRTDMDGNLLWKKEYQWGGFDKALSVDIATDGGFIISGEGTDIWGQGELLIIKTDKNGNREWEKSMGGSGSDAGICVVQSNDGTYVIAGCLYKSEQYDAWLVKVAPFENQRPINPSLEGPTSGVISNDYIYNITAIDPEDENLYYWFEWGDNTYTPWQGPYKSGETCKYTKDWSEVGNFTISAKARDPYGGDSDWVTLYVKIPRTRELFNFNWLSFLDHFPIIKEFLYG